MERFLLAVLLISCETATPASVTSTPESQFDPRNFTISLVNSPDDAVGSAAADAVAKELPTAWRVATRGLSSFSGARVPDVYIFFGEEPPSLTGTGRVQESWALLNPPLRFIYVHRTGRDATRDVIHELGHVLGCCQGAGAIGGHWADCPTPPIEIMCPMVGSATTFSDRELRAMTLLN